MLVRVPGVGRTLPGYGRCYIISDSFWRVHDNAMTCEENILPMVPLICGVWCFLCRQNVQTQINSRVAGTLRHHYARVTSPYCFWEKCWSRHSIHVTCETFMWDPWKSRQRDNGQTPCKRLRVWLIYLRFMAAQSSRRSRKFTTTCPMVIVTYTKSCAIGH